MMVFGQSHDGVDWQFKQRSESEAVESELEFSTICPSQLCGQIAEKWNSIRALNPKNSSPYFDIEFTKAVSRIRNDTEITVISDGADILGFFPFQRITPTHAEPIGGRLNDWHGIIGYPGIEVCWRRLLRESNLKSFGFHAIVETNLDKYTFRKLATHHLDLREGWPAYRQWVRKNSTTIKRQGQKIRGLEKAHGKIRFEFDSASSSELDELVQLKRAKYQRTKTFDILSVDWARDLLEEIHGLKTDNIQGILSTLWSGNELAAAHFGMLTSDTLHYWFPIFNPEFSKYSPGTELLMRVAEHAAEVGVTKVDLGYGDDPWKFKFANGSGSVSVGQVNFNPVQFHFAKRRYEWRQELKKIPFKKSTKRVFRKLFPRFGQGNFQ